ncbi:MAG: DMT family transporter [Parvularculaceae bacterium]|nr:DMT family transporter [Parvularculaceae bacterium]
MRLAALLALVLLAFSGNSLLTRGALDGELISAGLFSLLRLVSGGACLACLVLLQRGRPWPKVQDAGGMLALLGYVAAFSFAYVALGAGVGALILFGMVQVTTIGWSVVRREQLTTLAIVGVIIAAGGLAWLLRPGTENVPLASALLMAIAGLCWGAYTLLGRGAGDPTERTARNFVGASLLCLPLLIVPGTEAQPLGIAYACLSGAITSGLGYALWYRVLPNLSAITAGATQLLVPPATVMLAALLLAEPITVDLIISAVIILGGVALTFVKRA